MQTFLPDPVFDTCARVLDWRRLNKQITEAIQILNAVEKLQAGQDPGGWGNHPAVQMWIPYPEQLILYALVMAREWRGRGYSSHTQSVKRLKASLPDTSGWKDWPKPLWLGMDELHLSHQGNLIRKAPDHYRQFWPDVEPMEGYWWPTHHGY